MEFVLGIIVVASIVLTFLVVAIHIVWARSRREVNVFDPSEVVDARDTDVWALREDMEEAVIDW